ncbi:MAG: thiosulfate sulfurtransferase, partial [Rhodospirillaceae bacterium]|nr:thiosulfate sulfurtransferase [Rhodospirillaceae bacterium]
GVRKVDWATVERWRGESDKRTLYVFDVRLPEDYEAGHRPGTRSAQGGQLVQSTDSYIGTRGSRVVLVDDDGVRATMSASWLIQMGWEDVYVLDEGLGTGPLETGPEPVTVLGLDGKRPAMVSVDELAAMLEAGKATVVDLSTSREHKSKHIPGAWFAIRSRFASSLPRLDIADTLVLTSPDGALAQVAAAEAEACVQAPVKVLDGGTAAWLAAGRPKESGLERMLDSRDDIYLLPYEHETEVEKAMKAYLSWETALVPQVEEDGSASFHYFPTEGSQTSR